MRIGIDARELGGHPTGVGRYLAGLLGEWAIDGRARRHEFVLYASEPIALPLDAHRFPTRIIPAESSLWWEQIRLPRSAASDHLDVFFAPAYSAPLGLRVPVVLVVHDVSFTAHPEWFRFREGIRRRWLTRASVRQASAIIAVSEYSRRELVDHLGVAHSRVHVIPNGIRPVGSRGGQHGSDPRVLFVGSILNRRRVPDLIRAFGIVAGRHDAVALDLVGDNRTYPYENIHAIIAAHGMQGRVHWHRYASEEDLERLYANARAFAFLSEYEGFGMTPLEALAAGLPPVVLDTEVARESCGPAAIYVTRSDIEAIAHALEEALFDEPLRARVLAEAPDVLARYRWARAAADTLALIERSA